MGLEGGIFGVSDLNLTGLVNHIGDNLVLMLEALAAFTKLGHLLASLFDFIFLIGHGLVTSSTVVLAGVELVTGTELIFLLHGHMAVGVDSHTEDSIISLDLVVSPGTRLDILVLASKIDDLGLNSTILGGLITNNLAFRRGDDLNRFTNLDFFRSKRLRCADDGGEFLDGNSLSRTRSHGLGGLYDFGGLSLQKSSDLRDSGVEIEDVDGNVSRFAFLPGLQ